MEKALRSFWEHNYMHAFSEALSQERKFNKDGFPNTSSRAAAPLLARISTLLSLKECPVPFKCTAEPRRLLYRIIRLWMGWFCFLNVQVPINVFRNSSKVQLAQISLCIERTSLAALLQIKVCLFQSFQMHIHWTKSIHSNIKYVCNINNTHFGVTKMSENSRTAKRKSHNCHKSTW